MAKYFKTWGRNVKAKTPRKQTAFVSTVKPQVVKYYGFTPRKTFSTRGVIEENVSSARIRNALGQYKSAGKPMVTKAMRSLARYHRDRGSGVWMFPRVKTGGGMGDSGAPMGVGAANKILGRNVKYRVKKTITRRKGEAFGGSQIYKDHVEVGRAKLSKGWYTQKLIAGSSSAELSNTLRQRGFDSGFRNIYQSLKTGFNQKSYWYSDQFCWTRQNVLDAANIQLRKWGTLTDPNDSFAVDPIRRMMQYNSTLKAYLGITKLVNKVTIQNNNVYFPATVKIHVLAFHSPEEMVKEASYAGGYGDTTPSGDPTGNPGTVAIKDPGNWLGTCVLSLHPFPGAIPVARMIRTNTSFRIDPANFVGTCEPKTSLKMAPNFRRGVKVLTTLVKKLAPNDVWNFKLTQHLHRGINLTFWSHQEELSQQATTTYKNVPTNYFFILEVVGTPCEAMKTPVSPTSNKVLGTSPASLTIESIKSFEYVNGINNITNLEATENTAYPIRPYDDKMVVRPAIKTYQSGTVWSDSSITSIPNKTRIVNFDFKNLTQDPQDSIPDRYVIPVTSDYTIKYAETIDSIDEEPSN